MVNKKQGPALTTLQAFKAMYAFLEDYYERTSSDDVGGLLSDDWLQAVQGVMNKEI